MATKYKVFEVDASKWTAEMEMKHDYVKVYNGKVYFVSRGNVDYATQVKHLPAELGGWLLDCEMELVMNSNHKRALKNAEKAKAQLESDFEAGLKQALADFEAKEKTEQP